MARLHYAVPEDVIREIDPTLTGADLTDDALYGAADREKIVAQLSRAEDAFEDDTGHAFRSVRVGAPGHRASYESHDSDFRRYQRGTKFWLDHPDVVPLDPDAGDALLIREGRNSWRDVTDLEGELWRAEYPDGMIVLEALLRYVSPWRGGGTNDDTIRACYRYGALGGSRDRGGETTLTDTVGPEDTVFPVESVARLPDTGTLLVGGSEYVSLESVDYDTEEITVARGVDATEATDHDPGTTIGHCPPRIREAIAGKAAVWMLQTDTFADLLSTPDDSITHRGRIKDLNARYDRAVGKHQQGRML